MGPIQHRGTQRDRGAGQISARGTRCEYRRYHEVSVAEKIWEMKSGIGGTDVRSKALPKRWFKEVWNDGRRETIRELLAPEAVIQDGGDAAVGPEGFYPLFDRM